MRPRAVARLPGPALDGSRREAATLGDVPPPELPAQPEARATRLRRVLVLGSLSAFGPLSIDMYLPALPSLATDLGTGAAQVQLTLTASFVGLAAGQLVAGPLSDSRGRRRPLVVGLGLYALTSALCALAPSASALIGLRLLQGAAGGAGTVIARAVVRDLYAGDEAARFFGRLMLVNGLAPILAPVVGGQLLRVTTWRGVFVALAGIGLALFLAAVLALGESLPAGRRRSGGLGQVLRSFRRLLRDRVYVGHVLSCALAMGAMFAYIAGSPFVLERVYGVTPQVFGVAFGVNALGIVAAGQLSARLVGRVAPGRLLAAGLAANLLGGVALLAAAVWGAGLPGILPALFVMVSSLGVILPNATALALRDHPDMAGAASALLGLVQFATGGAVAPLVGVAGTGSALPLAVIVTGLGAGALLAFATLSWRRGSALRAAA
jgi:DHA1 family bicyclomycin/chloramphenicol resistance-like MFS transporter